MDLEIVKAIGLLQNPVLDWFFYLVTMIGDRYMMILLTAILYWTVDRRFAFRFVILYMISAGINVFIKGVFERPRPYLEEGVVVPSPYDTLTTGYSFPSGHSQAAGVLGWTAMHGNKITGRAVFKYVAVSILVLVPLSRIYLGQHYLTDVLAGAILGYVIACFGYKALSRIKEKEHIYALLLVPFLILGAFLYSDPEVVVALGGGAGFLIGYAFDRFFLDQEMKGSLLAQVGKVIIGFTGVMVLMTVFNGLEMEHSYVSFARYFMIGMWASFGAPVVFVYAFKND